MIFLDYGDVDELDSVQSPSLGSQDLPLGNNSLHKSNKNLHKAPKTSLKIHRNMIKMFVLVAILLIYEFSLHLTFLRSPEDITQNNSILLNLFSILPVTNLFYEA